MALSWVCLVAAPFPLMRSLLVLSCARYPCAWDGEDIVVMEQTRISPPYDEAHCTGSDDSALARIRRVVRGVVFCCGWPFRLPPAHPLLSPFRLGPPRWSVPQLAEQRKRMAM